MPNREEMTTEDAGARSHEDVPTVDSDDPADSTHPADAADSSNATDTADPTDAAADDGGSAPRGRLRGWFAGRRTGLSATGTAFAALAFLASFTPSLLPRPWLLQGVISALSMLSVYWIGVAVAWFVRWLAKVVGFEYSIKPTARRIITTAWVGFLVVLVIAVPAISSSWQTETAHRVGLPAPTFWNVVASLATTAVILLVLFALYRLIVGLNERLAGLGRRRLPRPVAKVLAGIVIAVVTVLLVDQIVLRPVLRFVERNVAASNSQIPPGASTPGSPLRSGGPGSPESWTSLGSEGMAFVASGPTASDITTVTGAVALDPIRVYAGLDGRSLAEVRDAVIAEMHRTGAFDRSAILVYTTTGRGWVNEWSASSFEYLQGGDTAIAAMQYSTLPSPIALLTDTSTPQTAGALLYDAVRQEIDALPEAERPRLYLGGESLGAYGGSSAFSNPEDMLASVDGAVWTGTPGFTPMHKTLTQSRQGGSTEINPVIDNGSHFRFASGPEELVADQYGRALGPWQEPRVVFLQHASDPVVWWSMDLVFSQPDWLRETYGGDVTDALTYYPFVTFWQVTADMAVATDIPSGHGHQYHAEVVPAWAGVLGHDPTADYDAIIDAIRNGVD